MLPMMGLGSDAYLFNTLHSLVLLRQVKVLDGPKKTQVTKISLKKEKASSIYLLGPNNCTIRRTPPVPVDSKAK